MDFSRKERVYCCVSREYPLAPIAGVGAVILDREKQHVVLIRRGHAPLQGEWSLPGGEVELGEALEAAVVREVREETGLQVKPVRVLKVFDRIHRDEAGRVQYHYVLVDFICRVTGGTLRADSDAAEACWASVSGLTQYDLSTTTLELIQTALADAS